MSYQTFEVGQVLTALDLQNVMDQTVIHVADAAERDAIPAPAVGMQVYRADRDRIEAFTGTTWGITPVDLSAYLMAGVTGRLTGRRIGNSVELSGNISGSFPSSSTTTDAWSALPDEWRPTGETRVGAAYSSGYAGIAVVRNDGSGAIGNRNGASWTGALFTITYLVD